MTTTLRSRRDETRLGAMRNSSPLIALLFLALGCSSNDDPAVDPGEVKTNQYQLGSDLFDGREAGPAEGELVILLHGFPQTSYEWRHQLRALGEAGYHAVALEQRGYSPGARPTDVAGYQVANLIGDALGLADHLGADRFHLVGHDWGAAVAWGLATAAPQRLISLTTISVPHPDAFDVQLADMSSCQWEASAYFDFFVGPGAESFFLADDAAQLRALYDELSQDAEDEYIRVLGNEPALAGALNWYRANVENRRFTLGTVGATTVPTLFIWGDQDVAICKEAPDATGDFVTGPYRYEILTGIGHWVPETASDRVSQLLLEQLAAHSQ